MAKAPHRFDRDDWVKLGLRVLAAHGPEALTLEQITAAAQKTRGSFYHHFKDHAAFIEALAKYWLQHNTDDVIAEAERALPAGKRRETLARRAARIDHALERQLRRLATSELTVAAMVAHADTLRINYVARLFRDELALSPPEALARARIEHCVFVGAQMVFPDADEHFLLGLEKTLGKTLWRE